MLEIKASNWMWRDAANRPLVDSHYSSPAKGQSHIPPPPPVMKMSPGGRIGAHSPEYNPDRHLRMDANFNTSFSSRQQLYYCLGSLDIWSGVEERVGPDKHSYLRRITTLHCKMWWWNSRRLLRAFILTRPSISPPFLLPGQVVPRCV